MRNIKLWSIQAILFLNITASALFASTYEYDSLNRLTKVTYDGGFQIVYSYDEVGNRTERIATIAPDVFADGIVNMQDLAVLGDYWMESNCGIPDWCDRADIDESGSVGFTDLGNIAEFWLKQSSYTVTASVIGGHGNISPTSSIYVYGYGSITNLIASPDSGYQVLSWIGTDNDSSRNRTNTLTVTDSRNVQVQFEPLYNLTTSVIGGNGSISPASGDYEYGAVVTLSATPDEGYCVKAWIGTDDDSSKNTTNTVTMNSLKDVSAQFEKLYTLTASVIGGHGSVQPASGSYTNGTVVTLTAIPDNCYQVKTWNGTDDDSSTSTTNTVTMDSDRIVTVEFEEVAQPEFENSGFESGGFTGWSLITDGPSEASVISPGFSESAHKAYLRAWEEWIPMPEPEPDEIITGRIELGRTVPVEAFSCYQVVFDYECVISNGATVSINGMNYYLNDGMNHFEAVTYAEESISIVVTLNGNGDVELYLDNFKIYCVDSGSIGDTVIVNGGFEMGNFTNWQISQSDLGSTYYGVGSSFTEGNYSAEIYAWSNAEIHLRSVNLIHAGILSFDYFAIGTEAYVSINGQQYALNTTGNIVSFSMPIVVTPIYQFEIVAKEETYMLIDNCQIQPF